MSETAENRPVAIHVSGVKKMYKLGQIGGGTLQADLQSWWAKKRGKEDPNSKIGEGERSHGDTFMALNGIDLTIFQGEAVGIIGSNGAGKSTLLKLLSRVTAPTDGEIDIYGRIASMLEVGTGFNGELTGRENVYMNGAILGMTKQEIDAKMEQIIDFSEVREFIDTPVKRYSSGMFVKLAFSVAAHLDAEIMIMDEVLAVGDMAFQKKCLEKMKEAAKKDGRTVLYVSHNMNTIRTLCDRCIILDKGKVVFEGDVEEAIQLYLSNNIKEESIFVDLEKCERPSVSLDKVHMHSFEFLDVDSCIYQRGTKVRFRINWKAKDDISEIQYRMILRQPDDIPIGLMQSPVIGNTVKSYEYNTIFEFNTNCLADGKYYLSIAFFQKDSVGNSVILDHVTRACVFEIISDLSDERMVNWERPYWGSISFPSLIICK